MTLNVTDYDMNVAVDKLNVTEYDMNIIADEYMMISIIFLLHIVNESFQSSLMTLYVYYF